MFIGNSQKGANSEELKTPKTQSPKSQAPKPQTMIAQTPKTLLNLQKERI